jgi:hypothetical protein
LLTAALAGTVNNAMKVPSIALRDKVICSECVFMLASNEWMQMRMRMVRHRR